MSDNELVNQADRLGIVIGAGAQGRVVAAVWARAEPSRRIVFLDDDPKLPGMEIGGIKVAGAVSALADLARTGAVAIVALGDNFARIEIAARIGSDVELANVLDPSAVVMADARLGRGVFVGPQAVIHTGAHLDDCVVVNTAAVVEHDCVVERGASISPGVRMAGRVRVRKHAFISVGATLVGRVSVGEAAIVGAGAVVTTDVPPGALVYGNPARVVRPVSPEDWRRLF